MAGRMSSSSILCRLPAATLAVLVGGAAFAGLAHSQTAPSPAAPVSEGPVAPAPVPIPNVPEAPPQEPAPAPDAAAVTPTPATPAPPPPLAKKAPDPEVQVPLTKRARYDVAVLQALDKITAQTVRFEASVGKPVRYKSLVFTVKACERSTDEEAVTDAIAFLTIDSQPKAAPGKPTPAPRQAFRGWMYASSPGLHPLEHPIYDAWLITCRAAAPS
jgi:hypothetical protein